MTASPSSERTRLRLNDVVENADRVAAYLGDMDDAAFVADQKTVDAVERCLSRITEAVIQMGEDEAERAGLGIPWREVRGLGNRLRHEYRRIDRHLIYRTARDKLPMLRAAASKALEN